MPAKILGVLKCVNKNFYYEIARKLFCTQHLKMSVKLNMQHYLSEVAGGIRSITYQIDDEYVHKGGYKRVHFKDYPEIDFVSTKNRLIVKLDWEDNLFFGTHSPIWRKASQGVIFNSLPVLFLVVCGLAWVINPSMKTIFL